MGWVTEHIANPWVLAEWFSILWAIGIALLAVSLVARGRLYRVLLTFSMCMFAVAVVLAVGGLAS